MGNVIVWAVLTALITGGIWGGIVFAQRLRRRVVFQEELLDDARRRLDQLEHVGDRVLDVEDPAGRCRTTTAAAAGGDDRTAAAGDMTHTHV